MARRPLDALILEDCEDDALLLVRELGRQGFDVTWERAWSATATKSLLEAKSWDAVLSDYSMPGFGAPEALRLIQESGQDLPFIVVSGTVGEEAAVAAMKNGAHDYLMKGHLARLGAAIERELGDARVRAERRLALDEVQHLNLALGAIRHINQLIVREKNPVRLVEEGCESLVETRGYDAAWIALFDDQRKATAVAGCGYAKAWEDVAEKLEHGKLPACAEAALASPRVVFINEQVSACQDCVIHQHVGPHETLTMRIEHQDLVYGVMAVTLLGDVPIGESETSLFEEVAGDLGFALWSIETERNRRTEEEKFRVAFDNANIGNVLTRPDGRLVRVNQAFCDLLGYSRAELEAKDFASITHPDDVIISREVLRCLLAGERASCRLEKRYLHKDGRAVWSDVSTTILHKQDGSPDKFITHVLDITERKNYQAQIAQSDRLASMGMLAAGVAHEINNPLAYVLYNLESLTEDLPQLSSALRNCLDLAAQRLGQDEWRALLGSDQELLNPVMLEDICARFEDALRGAHRIRDVARGLGTFSRVEQDRLVSVKLMHVVEVAINMVFNEIKYRARLIKEYGKTSATMANDGKLSQVFLNLLMNAAHSIPEGDVEGNEIRVRTWQEGDEVLAEIRDTGQGIAESQLPRLFEPFYTTKEIGVGTGLGLPISKNIIESYGGRIDVTSEMGVGTSFVVRLPVKPAGEPLEETQAAHSPARPEVKGRVLVIDDEAGIRAAMKRMLKEHDVVEAASGEEGRHLLEQDQAFDLILCDMMMPAVSGVELHRWLVGTHPVLADRLVFITGGAFTPGAREYLTQVDNLTFEKPFDVANFKKVVSELILAHQAKSSLGEPKS